MPEILALPSIALTVIALLGMPLFGAEQKNTFFTG
ncbi:MAG: hypothetical protein QOD41_3939 [Cryptosporangiaceae bacterium]|jgi:hypothetical protein|nr:hypothetical protein [Cryptosporangiaceae bacterium]